MGQAGNKRLQATKNEMVHSAVVVPKWVIVMLNTMFFRSCMAHPEAKKKQLDRFCIDCRSSFCVNCLPAHSLHQYIKIRRYIYTDVINRQDLHNLFDCFGIQTYLTNKSKVLFLKQRNPHHHQQQYQQQQQKQSHPRDCSCIVCDRSLHENTSLYCSIACKVMATYKNQYQKDEEFDNLQGQKKLKQSRKGVPSRAPMF